MGDYTSPAMTYGRMGHGGTISPLQFCNDMYAVVSPLLPYPSEAASSYSWVIV